MYDNLKTCIRTPEGELIELLHNSGCTGIYIDEKAPNVMVLLFADDVAFCADSVYRLQVMIRILEEFCSKWGLREKTWKKQK